MYYLKHLTKSSLGNSVTSRPISHTPTHFTTHHFTISTDIVPDFIWPDHPWATLVAKADRRPPLFRVLQQLKAGDFGVRGPVDPSVLTAVGCVIQIVVGDAGIRPCPNLESDHDILARLN